VALKFGVHGEGCPCRCFIRHQGRTQALPVRSRGIRSWIRESWRTLVSVVEPPLRHFDQVIEGKPCLGLLLTFYIINVPQAWVHLLFKSCRFCMSFFFSLPRVPLGRLECCAVHVCPMAPLKPVCDTILRYTFTGAGGAIPQRRDLS